MKLCMIFKVPIAVTIKIKVVWVMTPYSLIDSYRSFGKNLLSQSSIHKMETAGSSEMSVPINQTSLRYISEDEHNYVLNGINHTRLFKRKTRNAFGRRIYYESRDFLGRP
jgi:hypothetical protein